MADGRMINQSVATDERLNGLSQEAMLLYLMAVPHLDRDGLIDGRPRVLWARVAPLQDAWIQSTAALVDEWVEAGLVVRFEDGGGRAVLFFPGFQKNQKGMVYHRERPSRYDCPPGYERTKDGLAIFVESDDAREQIGLHHAEVMQAAGSGQTQSGGDGVDAREEIGKGRAHRVSKGSGARDEVMYQDQDQDQDQTEVKDQSDGGDVHHHSPGFGLGGVQGGAEPTNGHAAAPDLAYAFDEAQLRTAAYELGSYLDLHREWTNFKPWLAKQGAGTLTMLVEWIWWYREMPFEALQRVSNKPGMLRAHLNRSERAPLTTYQRQMLARGVQEACGIVQEVEE